MVNLFHFTRAVVIGSPLDTAARVRLRRLFWLGLGVLAGLWLWQWVSTDETGQPIAQNNDGPALEIDDLTSFTVRRHGLPLWQLNAKHVEVTADGSSTTASQVQRGVLFREGKALITLQAPRVRLANASNNVEASGGVSAQGPDGFSFQTSRALWINGLQTVQCTQPVAAQLRGLHFRAPFLSYNWDKSTLSCSQPVEVRAKGTVLRGNSLEASLKTRKLQLGGGVEMIFDPRATHFPLPH